VENRSPIISFGIACGTKRSSCWRLRAGVAKPELFLEREGQADRWHFSLHASGRWHMKMGRRERVSWGRPDELIPGYTRAVGLVQPLSVVDIESAPQENAKLVSVLPGSDPITFSIFIERPGANLNSWPGKNAMGTAFVGRVPMAGDMGTCCVVAHKEPLQPGEMHLNRPTDEKLAEMRAAAANGTLFMTLMGEFSDGAIALIDLRITRNMMSLQEAADSKRSDGMTSASAIHGPRRGEDQQP
jgi:hypothetical protein